MNASRDGMSTAEEPLAEMGGLRAITLDEFLAMAFPPREMVLDPIIPAQGLVMLHSKRGVGKTHVGLGIAYAVATGGTFLRWQAPCPRRVLYIDGEMPAVSLQERLAHLVQPSDLEPSSFDYLSIITPDLQDIGLPDLASAKGQDSIAEHLDGVELVIIDNLSALCRFGRENESESWSPVQSWILELRRRGISVLLIHHAGKGGQQRGTSRREDVLDTVINLRHPDDYTPDQGARFEVHIEKGRSILGEDAEAFEAWLQVRDDAAIWEMRDLEDVEMNRVIELTKEGLSVRDIQEETGISKSSVQRLRKKAQAEGLLEG
jgi:putative DNA primase/helicase